MINENQIDLIIERLIRRIEKANTYFLTKIGSSIKQIRDLSPSQAQQLAQILKYGGNYEEIIKEMSKYTEMNVEDLEDIFSNYAKKDQNFYKQFYQYKDIPYTPFDENLALKTQTMALSNIAKNEMYNFSRTNVLGYTINDEFYGLRETYNKLLDTAMLNIGQGKETFDMAMKRIMEDIGGSGIKTLNYESGRNVRLDSAIRMHLKSRLRELHNENQLLIGDEIEADGVEVSVHANPADDHAEIQGRQFSLEEWAKLQAGEEAEDYNGHIVQIKHSKHGGYRPISEMNCYHYIFSIVLGASEPEYTEEQLEEIQQENDEGFNFDEKHYTNYEGTQLQRALERKIREQKDIQILAKASGNEQLISQAQKKITQLTQKYRELAQKSGLATKMERMRVSGYRRTKVNNPSVSTTKKVNIQYKKYDDNESLFKANNPDIVLKARNSVIDEWTTDSGGYHANSGVMKYMTEDKELYGVHPGWEQGIKDIDNQITGKLSEPIITYRTIQIPANRLEKGQIVDKEGFIATSITRSNSNTAFNYGDSRSSTIEVEIDKGTRALYIGDKTGHHRNENELLFPPEYQIKITNKIIERDADGDYLRTIFKGKMINKNKKS